jgi:hypothetical protein
MKQRDFFRINEGEEIIGSSDVSSVVFDLGGFILTNQRVIKVDRTAMGGESSSHSFNLENLDSIQMVATKNNMYLWLALGALVFATIKPLRILSIFIAIGLLIIYFYSRTKLIKLTSGNSEMFINVSPMAYNQIQEMLFEIQEAKQKRLDRIREEDVQRLSKSAPKERLRDLRALLENGDITEEEYDEKRKRIIEEI